MKNQPEDAFINILTQSYTRLDDVADMTKRVELDLGCGSGSFTAGLAKRYPDAKILAADVMIGRLRKLVRKNQRLDISNMQLLRVEARHLVSYMIPDGALDRLHILCPDPWPKERHKGHRLVTSDFLSQIHRVLKKGGIVGSQGLFIGQVLRGGNVMDGSAVALIADADLAGIAQRQALTGFDARQEADDRLRLCRRGQGGFRRGGGHGRGHRGWRRYRPGQRHFRCGKADR